MQFDTTALPGVLLLTPRRFGDDRGFFMETYRADAFSEAAGQAVRFVQDNHSLSATPGTVRGLHFQAPGQAQGKLVRCIRGTILDVAVDIREGSPTYGQWVGEELSAENGRQLWVPEGFAHGFATLTENVEVCYKCTDYYSPEHEGSLMWNDPDLAIDWQIDPQTATLSEKDLQAEAFANFRSPFKYA